MDCREVRELADSFVAEELLTETNHDILRHLDECATCRSDIAGRRRLREGLRRAVLNDSSLTARPEFVEALRTRLRQETPHAMPAPPRRLQSWWLAAATVLLAVALGAFYSVRQWGPSGHALARAAAGDHRNCALEFRLDERPIRLADAALRYGEWYRILETTPPADVPAPNGPFRVVERHACVYQGRRFAHVVLVRGQQKVSLLVAEARSEDGENGAEAIAGVEDGGTVIAFRAIGRAAFIVGDIGEGEATALAVTLGRMLRTTA